MAEFLTTTDTSAAIERVIRSAKKELILISAYVYPRVIYLERLQDAAKRGVQITFIFGKKRMDEKVFALFQQIPNLNIYYLDVLHAKCFVNEDEAVVTSLNLLNGSEDKNREMGVRLLREGDGKAYSECVEEVRSILAVAKLVHTTSIIPVAEALELPEQGFCIRCGEDIGCDPDAPYCYEDFTVWVRYEDTDFQEKYCHVCGSKAKTTMGDPLCKACDVNYDAAMVELDASLSGSDFGKRVWRIPKRRSSI